MAIAFGFDYLIEQLGTAEGWILHRAPSHVPATSSDLPQPKKEEEHGVDYAFLTQDRRQLIIFVLKDEKLTYKNFDAAPVPHRSRSSCRARPEGAELSSVTSVRVILAYNKGEEEEGVEECNRWVAKLGTKVGDSVALTFERWNLDRIVDELQAKVFTPALLPPNFSGSSPTCACRWRISRTGLRNGSMSSCPIGGNSSPSSWRTRPRVRFGCSQLRSR